MATSNNVITQRRHDLDNLRTFLTGLVIVHHTAITYGGPGLGPYNSAFVPQVPASIPLTVFNAFNQSFFMGTFFWISGRVSAQSLAKTDEKSGNRWSFVKGKLLRLGVPAVFYTIAVHPIVVALALPRWDKEAIWEGVQTYFTDLRGVRGPVWYAATLLAFDVVTAILDPRHSNSPEKDPEIFRVSQRKYRIRQGLGWMAVACISLLIRLYYPVGSTIKLLGIQPAFLSQYIFAYTVGYLSIRHAEDRPIGPLTTYKPCRDREKRKRFMAAFNFDLLTATAISLSTIGICLVPYMISGKRGWGAQVLTDLWGGWNFPALAYAIWNEFSYAVIVPSLMQHFAWYCKQPAKKWLWQPRYSYAAFLVHYPISAATEVGVDQAMSLLRQKGVFQFDSSLWKIAGPVALTGVVGLINVMTSFGVGQLLADHVPGLKQIV